MYLNDSYNNFNFLIPKHTLMKKLSPLSIAEAKITQEILDRHYDTLYLYAKGLTNRLHLGIYDENDLMQQLFLKIARNPLEYKKRRTGYFIKILQHLVIDLDRKKKNSLKREERYQQYDSLTVSIHDHQKTNRLLELYETTCTGLNPTQDQIFRLLLQGYSQVEIAKRLNIPATTVATKVRRARIRLLNKWGSIDRIRAFLE